MIHFELIFVECVRFRLRFILFCFVLLCLWCPIAPCVEEILPDLKFLLYSYSNQALVSFCFVSNKFQSQSLWHRHGGDKCAAFLRVDYDLRVTQWHQYLSEGWGTGGDLSHTPCLSHYTLGKMPYRSCASEKKSSILDFKCLKSPPDCHVYVQPFYGWRFPACKATAI